MSPSSIALGILLLAGGCGDSSSLGIAQARENVAPRRGEIDPCTVLAEEDIKATLVLQLAEVKHESFPRPKCRYGLGPDNDAIVVYVFADASSSGGFDIGKRMQGAQTQNVLRAVSTSA